MHCAWPEAEAEVIEKPISLWQGMWGWHLNSHGDSLLTLYVSADPYALVLPPVFKCSTWDSRSKVGLKE